MKRIFFFSLILLFGVSLHAQIPTDSLLLYLPFNGNATDESGNGNNGLVYGASLTDDRFGNDNSAYHFNGINNFIQISDSESLNPTEQISICGWFKTQYFVGAGGNAILNKGFKSHIYPYYQYHLGVTGDYEPYSYYNFVTDLSVEDYRVHQVTENGLWVENEWYFLCLTYDGTHVKSYVNGELYKSSVHEGSINSYGQDIFIGKFGNANFYTPGDIDDIRMYSRALTDEEIKYLYYESPCITNTIIYDTLTVYLIDTLQIFDSIAVTDTLIIDVELGIDQNTIINSIKVYPNPTRDYVIIHTGEFEFMNGYKIRIVNSLSQFVFETIIDQQEYQINLNDFGEYGLYLFQIIDPEQQIVDTRKIILQ